MKTDNKKDILGGVSYVAYGVNMPDASTAIMCW